MSDFTITNLKQLDDAAKAWMPGIEAPLAREHLDSEHLDVTYIRYESGVRSPMARSHRIQEEAYVVIGGSGTITLNDEPHLIDRWDVIRVSPPIVRSLQAGAGGRELIAVGSDRPEGGNAVPGETYGARQDS